MRSAFFALALAVSLPAHAHAHAHRHRVGHVGHVRQTLTASWYAAPCRSSFASRRREWRGKAFAITYRGRTVRAVCRDYGPVRRDRDVDVSVDVARRLGFLRAGVARVTVRRVR